MAGTDLILLFFFISGLILLCLPKQRHKGFVCCLIGTVCFLLFSLNPVADYILRPLESRYPSYMQKNEVNYIVVLGSWHTDDPSIPLSSRLGAASLTRLVEALIIYRHQEHAKLLLSGPFRHEKVSNADTMAMIATALGINPVDILLEERPQNTKDEARLISAKLGKQPFILVTSAAHMPRAMRLFQKYGGTPIPAPTHFLVQPSSKMSLLPNIDALHKINIALHEYLGLTWIWIAQKM